MKVKDDPHVDVLSILPSDNPVEESVQKLGQPHVGRVRYLAVMLARFGGRSTSARAIYWTSSIEDRNESQV